MALDAIRKSLTSKISVQEELTDKDDEDVEKIIQKKPLVKTSSNTSSNFEANRASVANALLAGFNRRPSTKVYFILHKRSFLGAQATLGASNSLNLQGREDYEGRSRRNCLFEL